MYWHSDQDSEITVFPDLAGKKNCVFRRGYYDYTKEEQRANFSKDLASYKQQVEILENKLSELENN